MHISEIIKPDDWHVHFREGVFLKHIVPETAKNFGRAIVMPNLKNPIQDQMTALLYKDKILKYVDPNLNFEPLITYYLSEKINLKDLKSAFLNKNIFAAKLYPKGVTTNSSKGVDEIEKIFHLLEVMSDIGMPLLIHGETNEKEIDIFDREKVFIDLILEKITNRFPDLKVTLEHITTKFAVNYILSKSNNLKASITPHHLILNRNDLLLEKIKPHYYCLPILKRENDRKALLNVALEGNENFFLGTDSAPHDISQKETECGCAGIFNSVNCIQTLAQLFDNHNKLHNLEKFISINGSIHYNLNQNEMKIKLVKQNYPISFKKYLIFNNYKIKIFKPPFDVFWNYYDEGNTY